MITPNDHSIRERIIAYIVRYHKYHHYHYLQIPCQSVSVAARWHITVLSCAILKSEWRAIFSGIRSFSMLRVLHIVLRCSFSIFHSVSGFLIDASKALRRSSFAEYLTTWQNKYHWFRWLMSPDDLDDDDARKKSTSLKSHLLGQIAIPFKIQYLFQKCFKVPTEKYAFPTTTK